MRQYFRPHVQIDVARPKGACVLAAGWAWFDRVEVMERGKTEQIVPASELPHAIAERLLTERTPINGLSFSRPLTMGILNVTPDSFSDGGLFDDVDAAVHHARTLSEHSDILDIGGESTRPGATFVPADAEKARTAPVIRAIRKAGIETPISIDTRKAKVAQAALEAGANMLNDVSALTFDPEMATVAAQNEVPLCLMHAQGDPKSMQENPQYDDIALDVYDHLDAQIQRAEAAGLARGNVIVDPGIGFGKTAAHNFALLQRISLFHSLGCPILLGVSRKRFIGTYGNAPDPLDRLGGSIGLAVAAVMQGVQIVRAHDTMATEQALQLVSAQLDQ